MQGSRPELWVGSVSVGAAASQPLVPGSQTRTNHATRYGATETKKASLNQYSVTMYMVPRNYVHSRHGHEPARLIF